MTKLEVGKKYWFKGRLVTIDANDDIRPYAVDFNQEDTRSWLRSEIEVAEAIPERERVTIPKFVADWIKKCKDKEYHLSIGLEEGITEGSAEFTNWFCDRSNQDTFARAWLDGYKIKKEPLYTVEIPDPNRKGNNRIYLGKADNTGKVFINKGTFNPKKNKNLWLTESEIKEDFEWAWKFAVPVEEEE